MNPVRLNQLLQKAVSFHQAGRLDAARPLYDEIHRAAPKNFDAVHLAGLLALQQNRPAAAAPLLSQAVRLNPRSALAEMRLGAALMSLEKPVEAEPHLRRALTLEPTQPEAWGHLIACLKQQGKPREARAACEQLLRINPSSLGTRQTLSALIADLEGFAAALPALRELTTLAPESPLHWCNLGLAYVSLGQLFEGSAALDRAASLDPTFASALVGKAFALQQAHRISEAADAYDRALALDPTQLGAASARLLCLNYLDTMTAEQLHAKHRLFETLLPPLFSPSRPAIDFNPDRRLRVAILSPDLRSHSVAYFLEPLLRHLDREQFEIILYHDHFTVDATSERLRAHADLWRNFVGLPSSVVESQIRADSPDILVDLAGHTGFNRLPLFARRLAPVQLSYLGYPNTTGLAAMDFRLTDLIADPHGLADRLHSEKLLRFSSCAWAYDPPASAPPVPPPPFSSSSRPFSFGSFNAPAKLSDATLHLWSRVLAAVPDSRLVLKGHGLNDPEVAPYLLKRLERLNVSADRIILLGRTPALAGHLASYAEIDVALDPSPYNGTTTTCEALWMGRPVITLAGDRHASRVGASLLSAVNHPEWIAHSHDDYVRIAQDLASDPSRLSLLSSSLRPEMLASALLDHKGQASRFGLALRSSWRETLETTTALSA